MEEEAPGLEFDADKRRAVCGGRHTITLDSEDNVWVLGDNKFGQLGLGDVKTLCVPRKLEIEIAVASIACGYFHSVIVDVTDRMWSFGRNAYGQLGVGDFVDRREPTLVTLFANHINTIFVSCGLHHTLCIDSDNEVWAFGKNNLGQLGVGDCKDRNSPEHIKTIHDAISVAGGLDHSIFLIATGNVLASGDNSKNQLGISKSIKLQKKPILIKNLSGVSSIACGSFHTLALTRDKTVIGFGVNDSGQLGFASSGYKASSSSKPIRIRWEDSEIVIVAISAGYNHSMALDSNGSLWTWGLNRDGQTGHITSGSVMIPSKLNQIVGVSYWSYGGNHVLVKNIENQIWCFGANGFRQLLASRVDRKPTICNPKFFHIIGHQDKRLRTKSARK